MRRSVNSRRQYSIAKNRHCLARLLGSYLVLLHTACAPLTKLLDLPSPRHRLLLAFFSLLLCCYHGTHLTARSDSAGSQLSDHVAQPPPYKSVLKQKTSRQTSNVCFQLSLNQGSRNSTYEIRQAITVANKLSVAAPPEGTWH